MSPLSIKPRLTRNMSINPRTSDPDPGDFINNQTTIRPDKRTVINTRVTLTQMETFERMLMGINMRASRFLAMREASSLQGLPTTFPERAGSQPRRHLGQPVLSRLTILLNSKLFLTWTNGGNGQSQNKCPSPSTPPQKRQETFSAQKGSL